jgi:hypothetical protein
MRKVKYFQSALFSLVRARSGTAKAENKAASSNILIFHYSINYIHYGAGKYWIIIAPEFAQQFEDAINTVQAFASEAKKCKGHLRHKNILVSPEWLASKGVPFQTVYQAAGQFLFLQPGSYHAGNILVYLIIHIYVGKLS